MLAARTAALGLSLWLAAGLGAQEVRRPVFGRVLFGESPVPAAQVTLVGWASGAEPTGAALDEVRVLADGRGRFRAMVRPWLPYCAIALGRHGGAAVASPHVGWFGNGAVVDLRCQPAAEVALPELSGREGWAGLGPIEFVWWPLVADSGIALPAGLDRGAALALPRSLLAAQRPGGELLWLSDAPPGVGQAQQLPPLRRIPCEVLDPQGQPVVGATVSARLRGVHDGAIDGVETWRGHREGRLGETGDQGKAELLLPWPAEPLDPQSGRSLLFVARKQGRAESVSGVHSRAVLRDGRRGEPAAGGGLRFTLAQAEPLRGKVSLPVGLSAAGATVRLRAVARLQIAERGYQHDARSWTAPISEDGRFELGGVIEDVHSAQWLVSLADGRPILFGSCRDEIGSPDLDARAFGGASIEVFDARDGPAIGRVLYLQMLAKDETQARDRQMRLPVQANGRVELPLLPGPWAVHCIDEEGAGMAEFDVEAGRDVQVRLRMRPYPRLTGVVQDRRGQPVAGASFRVRTTRLALALAQSMLRKRFSRMIPAERTGADGSFSLPCPGVEGLRIAVRAQLEQDWSQDAELSLEEAMPVLLRWQ